MGIKQEVIQRVMSLMGWHYEKALLWYQTANPNFGNVSPEYLVEMGRGHKVINFIQTAEEENKPHE